MRDLTLLVIAKEPLPGRAKTRLSPPCTPAQAAELAEAALADTLEAVRRTPASRRLLVLEGRTGPWLPTGFETVPQTSGDLGTRLAAAFAATSGPALLIGMDTPQASPQLLADAAATLFDPGTDAVLGPADDGGYWAIGLKRADARVFDGVPMSSGRTCAAQRSRLAELGLRHRELPRLRDVDTFADAGWVAARCRSDSRFRAAFAPLDPTRPEPAPIDGRAQWATA